MMNREALALTSTRRDGANGGGVGTEQQEQKFPRVHLTIHRVWTRISAPHNFKQTYRRCGGIYR